MTENGAAKVALIGAGLQGKRWAQTLTQSESLRGRVELTVIADSDLARARGLADSIDCDASADWQDVVARDGVDIVIDCTPPHLHAQIAIAAMKRGKHVLTEKPLARTVAEAREMVETADQMGVVLKCGFNLRHHPGILQARRWLDEDRIGRILSLRCRYGVGGREGYDQDWRSNPEISGGGQIMDQGVHAFDLARWFLGDFQDVFGMAETLYWDIAPVEDNGFCLLRTADRHVASVHVSWSQWKPLFSLELFGTEGYVTVEGLGGAYGVERASVGARDFTKPFQEETIEYRGRDASWEAEIHEMLRAIQERVHPSGSGLDGLRALELTDAVYRSASEGRTVRLETVPQLG